MAEQTVLDTKECQSSKNRVCSSASYPRQVSGKPVLPYQEPRYVIHNKIGSGGGGTVYSGTRVSDGRHVVLKYVRDDKVTRWDTLNGCRVPVEFSFLHTLTISRSPGVIRMIDCYRDNASYVLVMERLPDFIDLHDFLYDHGSLSEDVCRGIVYQLANALMGCHDNGIVHRDIKLENVLINPHTHEVKLIDFGCGTKLTMIPELRLCGTRDYYPPEWFTEGCYFGDRLDTWCLGMLLYMLVEGQLPFNDEKEIINCKVRHSLGRQFSNQYRRLMKYLLHKDQERRPFLEDILAHPWLRDDLDEPKVRTGFFRSFFKRFRRR